jgi:hypothetical protein
MMSNGSVLAALSLGSHGYAQIWDSYVALVHRWVMGAVRGDGQIVDHVNRQKLDNRKTNLRFVTAAESSANVSSHASSGYRGVYRNRDKWAAAVKCGGIKVNLGTYPDKEIAAQVAHEWRLANLPGYVDGGLAA